MSINIVKETEDELADFQALFSYLSPNSQIMKQLPMERERGIRCGEMRERDEGPGEGGERLGCLENPPNLTPGYGGGTVQELGGLETYVTGPSDSNLAILLLSDVLGCVYLLS
ncbi:hypothetical protein OIU84_028148 [Salix udensis]|uniref:Uncharacterized protein n=1 Tax=Salix udensis TaxID=889485 RepID=A0AAD6KBY5_9ROSI|nr:hypothetical protein OIU84_028148 [Salix udensis]